MFLMKFFIFTAAAVHLALAHTKLDPAPETKAHPAQSEELRKNDELTWKWMSERGLVGRKLMELLGNFTINGYDQLIKMTQLDQNKDDMVKATTCMVGYLRKAIVFWKFAAMLQRTMMETVLVANEKLGKCGDDWKCKDDVIEEVKTMLLYPSQGLQLISDYYVRFLREKLLKCQK